MPRLPHKSFPERGRRENGYRENCRTRSDSSTISRVNESTLNQKSENSGSTKISYRGNLRELIKAMYFIYSGSVIIDFYSLILQMCRVVYIQNKKNCEIKLYISEM